MGLISSPRKARGLWVGRVGGGQGKAARVTFADQGKERECEALVCAAEKANEWLAGR